MNYRAFKDGRFKSKLCPSVLGVGYLGIGKYRTHLSNDEFNPAYYRWRHILYRCYGKKSEKEYPTYNDVEVCDEWFNYQNFARWYYENIVDENTIYDVDKDISGAKIYSPSTCFLVPHNLNVALVKEPKIIRNDLPIGIGQSKNSSKYYANISKYNKTYQKSGFKTPEEAFQWYKSQKESYIQELANQYKSVITPRAYEALMNYKVKPYPYESRKR